MIWTSAHSSAELTVTACEITGGAVLRSRVTGAEGTEVAVCVEGEAAVRLAREICARAGRAVPVIELPPLEPGRPETAAGVRVAVEERGIVRLTDIATHAWHLASARGVRELAAVLLAKADEAAAEPETAEVEELAAVLRECHERGCEPWDEQARAILRAGYRRADG